MYYFHLIVVNSLAGVRLFLSPFVVFASYSGDWNTSMVCISLGAVTDFYDGPLARSWEVVTKAGFWIDMLPDRALLLAPLLGVALRGLIPIWLFVVVIFGIVLTDLFSLREGRVSMLQMVYWWIVEGLIVFIIFLETSAGFVVFWATALIILSTPLLLFRGKREEAKEWLVRFKIIK